MVVKKLRSLSHLLMSFLCNLSHAIWYRLQHCLELVMRVYEQTHSRQCCNPLISWLWTQSVIVLPGVARACDDKKYSTPQLTAKKTSSAHMRSAWWINGVLLRISIWFSCHFAGFHVANRAVTLLLYTPCSEKSNIFIFTIYFSQFLGKSYETFSEYP